MATSRSSGTSAVVDASAAVRALVWFDAAAAAWLDQPVAWPSILYAEVGHVSLRLCRSGLVTAARAGDVLDALYAVAASVEPVERLVRVAWEAARERGLTVYDACYAVLAQELDVPLVTADRRLAAAVRNAVVITG